MQIMTTHNGLLNGPDCKSREESVLVHILKSIIIYLHVQQPCKFIGMKESVSIRKELSSHGIGLVQ